MTGVERDERGRDFFSGSGEELNRSELYAPDLGLGGKRVC